MNELRAYLVLPEAVSQFEAQYLARMNRVGLVFLAAHVPIFVLFAAFNGTGPGLAALLTTLTMLGPIIANLAFQNPRAISVTYGFTAMIMGALLVHFGQGPMQIEMHFYFFVLIALLSVYANPRVILVAAATVAAHHLLLWLWLPRSVFNYAAPLWVVGLHAAFVLLESIAACFLARSFFDNVIGLERIVATRTAQLDARNRDLRMVFDNVDQALLTLDRGAVIGPESSAMTRDWFGSSLAGRPFVALLREFDECAAATFELAWQQLLDGFLPRDIALLQLPRNIVLASRTLRLEYKSIEEDGEIERVLLIATDVTSELLRERLALEKKESHALFERILADRRGVVEFFHEADTLVRGIARSGSEGGLPAIKRALHTLKGVSSLFGVRTVAEICHAIESRVADDLSEPTPAECSRLSNRWAQVRADLEGFLGARDAIEIRADQLERVTSALAERRAHGEILQMVNRWKLSPARQRLQRLGEQAQELADRLDKGPVTVTIGADDIYLDMASWGRLFAVYGHAVRNAVDHGIESHAERVAKGKPEAGRLLLEARIDGSEFVIAISDDGRGIDWEAVRAKAHAGGLRSDGRAELIEALFADGISTKAEIDDVSGRGVGMGALRQVCQEMGGRIALPEPEGGVGTRIELRFPKSTAGVDHTGARSVRPPSHAPRSSESERARAMA